MPKTKRRRIPSVPEHVRYLVAISSWDWGYSFGVNRARHIEGRFSEYAHLELTGTLVSPKGLKTENVEVILMPNVEYNADRREKGYLASDTKERQKWAIGPIRSSGDKLQALLPLPADMLAPVLSGIISGRLEYITMTGDQMRYRQGAIDYYALRSSYDAEDWPNEAAAQDLTIAQAVR